MNFMRIEEKPPRSISFVGQDTIFENKVRKTQREKLEESIKSKKQEIAALKNSVTNLLGETKNSLVLIHAETLLGGMGSLGAEKIEKLNEGIFCYLSSLEEEEKACKKLLKTGFFDNTSNNQKSALSEIIEIKKYYSKFLEILKSILYPKLISIKKPMLEMRR